MIWVYFHMCISHLCIPPLKKCFSNFSHFLIEMLVFIDYKNLHIFCIIPDLYQIWDVQLLLPLFGLFFTFLIIFYEHKSLYLSWSPVYIFSFACAFGVISKRNHCLIQDHEDLHLCFPLWIFIVLTLTFRSTFILTFIYGVRDHTSSTLLHTAIQLLRLKRLFFPPVELSSHREWLIEAIDVWVFKYFSF